MAIYHTVTGFQVRLTSEFGHPNSVLAETFRKFLPYNGVAC